MDPTEAASLFETTLSYLMIEAKSILIQEII
jgi:hypothetical protein